MRYVILDPVTNMASLSFAEKAKGNEKKEIFCLCLNTDNIIILPTTF